MIVSLLGASSRDIFLYTFHVIIIQVPPQEMLSRDSVTVSVDAVCFYKVPSFFSLWGSIFFQSAFKTFNTYSRFDLFYSRQTCLFVLAFNLLRQLSQSGIFHLSFVKPAHIHLLETIMSPFFHQISPYQITNAAKKKYEKLER